MPSSPRTGMEVVARLAMALSLLWLACGEAPRGGSGAVLRKGFEPKALQATSSGQWSFTGPLLTARWGHTATLLPSGKVLVTGGEDLIRFLTRAEVYDPGTGEWRTTDPLAMARRGHAATLLPSGKVLVTGGWNSRYTPLARAELYDPGTEKWHTTSDSFKARANHTATLLPSGKVLVTGGEDWNGSLKSAEVYDPGTGEWRTTNALAEARAN
ncbi:Kelch repeat-containing protein, partial [Archangium gephyra]|uniref:Kelch repeat-containing protein n=1 Tax=Archangium gephyra TaxID=48 RepID=UPI0030B80DCC